MCKCLGENSSIFFKKIIRMLFLRTINGCLHTKTRHSHELIFYHVYEKVIFARL